MLWIQGPVFQAGGKPDAKALEAGVCLACSKKFSQARWLKPVISALTWGRREVQEFRVILYIVSSEASKPGIQDTLSKTYPRNGGEGGERK